jgi:hypothetical protein
MELPKNVRSTSFNETADAARDGSCDDKEIAPTRNASARAGARPHPSPESRELRL